METANSIYLQQEGESFLDWKLRLLVGKIEKEIDLDWEEIRDILNLDCSADHLRKTAYGIVEYAQYFQSKLEEDIEDDEIINRLEQKKIELQIERKKNQTMALEFNRILREEGRRQLIVEEVKKSIEKTSPPPLNVLPISKKDMGYLLGFSDIHFGKVVDSITNKYDESILLQKMSLLLSETIEICKKENISILHVLNCADSIDGILRISQLTALQMGITDSVIRFSRMMVEWLNKLSQHVEIVYHHIMSSNHSELRPLGTKAGQFPKEDMERVIFTYIHDMLLDNPRITIPEYTRDFARFDICGFKFFANHGQNLKNINNSIKDLSMLHREFIDYYITAHLHHGEEVTLHEGKSHNCEVILLPSIMGSDEYSDALMKGSKSGAKLCVFQKDKGHVQTYNIILN